jgi:undecaprenyl pyrophosphate phosphatase UppP
MSDPNSKHKKGDFKVNKTMGILMIALALVIAIVPIFTDCLANGRTLTTADGRSIPMKCHWTAIAEIGLAVPLALVGVFNFTSKRKETLRSLNLISLALGALVILFPTVLIGVCANQMMECNMIEKPTLILSGIVVMGASLITLGTSRNFIEPAAA